MTKKQILVVENETYSAAIIKRILSQDYTITVVSTGKEAVQQVVKMRPALVLMDIQLPGVLDGIEAAEQIRARLDVPLIYLTAYADNQLSQRAKTTGPYSYLVKPFKHKELLIAVEMALYKHQVETELKKKLEQRIAERAAQLEARMAEIDDLNRASANLLQDLQASNFLLTQTSQELQHANNLLTALGQVVGQLQTSLDPRQVLETLGAEIKQLNLTAFLLNLNENQELVLNFLAVDTGSLFQAEKIAGLPALGFKLRRDRFPHYPALVKKRQAVYVASKVSRQVAALLPDLSEAQLERILHEIRLTDNSRLVYLPLTVEARLLGVLGMWGETLREVDLPVLSIFAGQVAAAMEMARLHEQLKAEHIEEQAALLRLSRALQGELDSQAVIELAVRETAGVLGVEFAVIALVDVDGQHYSVRAGFGWPPESLRQIQRITLDNNTNMAHVIRTQSPFILDDTDMDTRLEAHYKPPPFVTEIETKAALITPMLVDGVAIGGLAVNSRKARRWAEDEVRLLSLIANETVQALERTRLFQAERRERLQAETLSQVALALVSQTDLTAVLDEILSQAGRLVPYQTANIALLEGDTLRIVAWRGYDAFGLGSFMTNPTQPLVRISTYRRDIQSAQPVLIADTRLEPNWVTLEQTAWIRCYLALPIRLQGKTLGLLRLDGAKPGEFSPDDAERLKPLVNAAAIALENARLFEAERKQRELAESLRNTADILNRTLHLDEVLDRILDNAGLIVAYDAADILLVDPDGIVSIGRYRGYVERGLEDWAKARRFRLADFPVLKRLTHSEETLVIPDTHNYPGWVVVPETRWIRSSLYAPINIAGQLTGFITLSSVTPNHYTFGQGEYLQIFADQAAAAIQNARLFEQVQTTHKQLRDLAGHLETALEKERTRIARELHDEFGQALTALRFDLSWLAKNQPHDISILTQKIEVMLNLVDDTMQMVRRIATQLRPDILDDLGLTAALEWQAEEFATRTGLICELNLGREDIILEPDISTAVFRTFQETLTNIVRHAGASRVWVTLKDRPEEVVLRVQDNGRGISDRQESNSKSLGIIGMQERARAWNGQITFHGQPSQGTTVTLRIPRQPHRSQSDP